MDFTQAVEIAKHIYWIGMYLENDPFQCHPYFIENGDESILIDPGSMLEFEAVVRKVNTISSMKNIKYIILHHQDPDLAAAVPEMEKLIDRSDLLVITHSRMVPLVKHYLIRSDYYEIDKHGHQLVSGDLHLQFVTTPYCHSPGAFVTYEPFTKTLFSGDIFGGIEESWEFFAGKDYFEKAKPFHAEYMPSRDIFNYALTKIEKLELEMIAPQHGSIIQKEKIAGLIEKMKALECGLYIEKEYKDRLIHTIEELKEKDLALRASMQEIKEKEELLFQKAKMADMGEMIANIAHQWRQPLALNNTLISILKEKNQQEALRSTELAEKLQEMENNIQYMSKTIDDFMHFFHPKKEKNLFLISEVVRHTLEITDPMLKKAGVSLTFEISSEEAVEGYMNEYMQVVISILHNAKDTLLHRKTKDPDISLRLYENGKDVVLDIGDNAGGVQQENIHRIFDPYFTTKHKSLGTGLGLYISKMIIEKNMDGTLSISNTQDGALFRITLPRQSKTGKTDATQPDH
ncbi:histidine kinase [Sulfurovum lithotrophicum]|uniref:histidine kinase n=1 Tax=Sulfurovum lithotrophicum TaxID=206403 RepID=A0A7U4M084_9BACT|nr:ATP-binding protein [Sulfurovum lithotrophicum]AKF24464.1 histidine kinase [Sulfurovum lithotrophicum]